MKKILVLFFILLGVNAISQEVMFNDTPTGKCIDETSVELGMRFMTEDTITITAIRFYKCKNDIGTYIVKLYAGSSIAASARYSGNVVGWVSIPINPVKAIPGVEYVSAYYSPNGIYQAVDDYGWNFSRGSVRAIMSVYKYGSNSNTLPTSFYQTSNYFADIVFTPKIPFYKPLDTIYLPRVCPPDSQHYLTDTLYLPDTTYSINVELDGFDSTNYLDLNKFVEVKYLTLPNGAIWKFSAKIVKQWFKHEWDEVTQTWIEK